MDISEWGCSYTYFGYEYVEILVFKAVRPNILIYIKTS